MPAHPSDQPPPAGETTTPAASPPSAETAPRPHGEGSGPADWPGIPGYEILGELGRGAMGIVYRARQIALNRPVALKMILAGSYARPDERARFRTEAEAIARLNHAHIVRVYDFGEHQGLPYFAMELLEGGSLARKLGNQPLSSGEAADLVEKLSRAIHSAHEQQVIHRDLKPGNVLFTSDGTPRIADFGLARKLDEDQRLTATQAVLGTPCYMAPEQAAGQAREVGPAADIYALGAILYETLTGRPPFKGATRELTMAQVQLDEPVRPAQFRPDVPADLEAICLKCLEKEPGRRYATPLDLAEDLRRFQQGEVVSVQPEGDWERQVRWARRAGYEILELWGASVTGLVYRARQVRLNRLVALKIISPQAGTDPELMARFRTEAEVAARLRHPNIVQIFDFGEHQGQSYFSMEFMDGGTLLDRCTGVPVPPRQAAELLHTLAGATSSAHAEEVVHGDLRPFNVLLTATGVPKITGFGLAVLLRENKPDARAAWRGLSNYMAPEQAARRSQDVGPATDVHALGAMLYEMLTGRPPFLADTVEGTLKQILHQEPVPPSRWQPGLPRRLDALCLKCLQKDPRRRYADAAELAEDLAHFLSGRRLQHEGPSVWQRLAGWLTRSSRSI